MLQIVLIEDNPGDARLINELLKDADALISGHVVRHFDRVGQALEYLSTAPEVDILLSDITLPDSRGVDTFESLHTIATNFPILFMTGSNDDELAIAAIHKGAQDYMIKGHITADGLARAILYAIERTKFQAEMNHAKEELYANQQRMELLSAQKKQLLSLNKAKDEFISIASHQLRTPATAVKQYIGMVLEGYLGELDQRQTKALQIAYESNERQLDVIKELLKTAQMDSNKVAIKPELTDISSLIANLIDKHAATFKMRSQTIVFNRSSVFRATVDIPEISLALENVIENASKYTPPHKKIHVTISQHKNKLTIDIIDEGVGISPENQTKIFDKFTRIDNSMSDTVTGTGLGLYWVKKILKLHKGTISVKSKLGEGSTFTICIPV